MVKRSYPNFQLAIPHKSRMETKIFSGSQLAAHKAYSQHDLVRYASGIKAYRLQPKH